MAKRAPTRSGLPPVSSRRLLALLVLFFASGCAALIFEVTWLQLLQLVIGSSAVSVGVLLATYMGGMCLGALAAPRSVSTLRHPLRAYAVLELTIGVIGVVELFVIPLAGGVYAAHFGSGWLGMLARGLVCGVCLLPPTILMGATLPVVARWLNTAPNGMSAVGLLYSGNTAGASQDKQPTGCGDGRRSTQHPGAELGEPRCVILTMAPRSQARRSAQA